jgi:hypothetical protein
MDKLIQLTVSSSSFFSLSNSAQGLEENYEYDNLCAGIT